MVFAINFTPSSMMSTIQPHHFFTWQNLNMLILEAPYRPLREFSDVAAGLVLWQSWGKLFREFAFWRGCSVQI